MDLMVYGPPEKLANLLPSGWRRDHTIEATDKGLCIRGPRASQAQHLLTHALQVLHVFKATRHGSAELLMAQADWLESWARLTLVENGHGMVRIGGDAQACLGVFKALQAIDGLLACRLFLRLSSGLQYLVLQASAWSADNFVLRLEQEGALAAERACSTVSGVEDIEAVLNDIDCRGLLQDMGPLFLRLGRRAIDEGDVSRLRLVLEHCPSAVLRELLAEAQDSLGDSVDAVFLSLCQAAIRSLHAPRLAAVLAECPASALSAVWAAVVSVRNLPAWLAASPALEKAVQAGLRSRPA